jgi:hypothetical protein
MSREIFAHPRYRSGPSLNCNWPISRHRLLACESAINRSRPIETRPFSLKRSRLQDRIPKRQAQSECVVRAKRLSKRSDVTIRACGKRTANALCALS